MHLDFYPISTLGALLGIFGIIVLAYNPEYDWPVALIVGGVLILLIGLSTGS